MKPIHYIVIIAALLLPSMALSQSSTYSVTVDGQTTKTVTVTVTPPELTDMDLLIIKSRANATVNGYITDSIMNDSEIVENRNRINREKEKEAIEKKRTATMTTDELISESRKKSSNVPAPVDNSEMGQIIAKSRAKAAEYGKN